MATQSLLGHIATQFAFHPENLATESLAYILARSRSARRSLARFVRQLEVQVPDDLTFRTQVSDENGTIPDLVGVDGDGNQAIILEAKFWAGLTDSQPVAYLDRLPQERDGVLLFVTPSLRLHTLWLELLARCREANLPLGLDRGEVGELKARTLSRGHMIAITSWRTLLSHVRQDMDAEGDMAGIADLLQLLGLCERMDEEAFLPLRSEELSPLFGLRILQFCSLVDEVASRAVQEGWATYYGRISAGAGVYYRPCIVHGCGCYLQVNAAHWVRYLATPLWLTVQDIQEGKWILTERIKTTLARLRLEDPPRLLDSPNALLIPLRVPLGVERPRVVDVLLAQVREVVDLLQTSQTGGELV